MKHFNWFILIQIILLVACNSKDEAIEEAAPNIIFICPDQYRNYSLGFWSKPGNKEFLQGNPDPVSTPALDKLAEGGIVFSRAVSNFPLCSPYRGMLLSGMYPYQNGITNNCRADRDVQLRTDAICITDVFAQADYNVAYFGKCHWQKTEPLFDENGTFVGSKEAPGGHFINRYDTYVPPGPDRHSIDYFFQALKDDHFNPLVYSNDPKAIEGKKDGEPYKPGKFSAELESEKIIDYLSNTHGQRDPQKPFFLMWSLNPPHNPWTEKSTYMEFFDQYTDSGNIHIDQLLTHENADTAVGHYAPYYYANVSAVDHFIGKVLDHLAKLGLSENTIIVFSSDHGEMLGSHGKTGKNTPEIEAYNIPFIIKWGDKLKPRIEDLILSVPDVMPTLLSLAGMEDKIPDEVQGKNYASILKKSSGDDLEKPASALFMNGNSRGVYTGKYMFVVNQKDGKADEVFCYDNEADPNQLNRIPFEKIEASVGKKLIKELEFLLKQTDDKWYQDKVCGEFLDY
ncbi:sulfatase family protein [Flexithrix dorotheae]|uniref:sulfatase family protein n=1 Tax=Flexithrix dorotheae TaxID=70993 RepID=UPI00036D1545|nr:sulfatase [Flexithrix dorotheae]